VKWLTPVKPEKNACPASALFQCSLIRSGAANAAAADHKATPPPPMEKARRAAAAGHKTTQRRRRSPVRRRTALIWLPITHFHNTGYILHYSKFPSLSLDLSLLFASCDSFPFHLSFIPIFRPSPSFDTAVGLGERCKLPQRVLAESGRQMQFGEFWALK